jgi:hypothetical protein
MREGRAVNIHMLCARRPGLLLSAMRAIEGLGLDVQQAVISCFNGFSLDIFKAEVCTIQLHISFFSFSLSEPDTYIAIHKDGEVHAQAVMF